MTQINQDNDVTIILNCILDSQKTELEKSVILDAWDRILPMILPLPPFGYEYRVILQPKNGTGITHCIKNVSRKNVMFSVIKIKGEDR